jgi:AraC-like DNA-binding protein
VQVYNGLLGVGTPRIVMLANLGLIFAAATTIALSFRQGATSNWLIAGLRRAEEAREASPRDRRLLAALLEALETKRVYRDEALSVGRLARQLGASERHLRQLINRQLGYRNFTDLLHAYRIREACARLREPEAAQIPVLSIALEAGFASVGPFNRAFKSRVGMTPSRFRELASRTG